MLAENRKARFDYDFLEEFEAGIELTGQEVKAVRAGKMNISGAYVIIRGGEAYLIGSDIPPFQPKNQSKDYEATRTRRLLLHKREIKRLSGLVRERGLTLVAFKVYDKSGKVKVIFALARHKKGYDKREKMRQEEVKTEIRRRLKSSSLE